MGKYIKKFDTHSDYEDFIETEDFIRPNVSYCVDNKDVHYNSTQTLFALEIESEKFISFYFQSGTLYGNTDDGSSALWVLDGSGVVVGNISYPITERTPILAQINEHYGTSFTGWSDNEIGLSIGDSLPNWNAYEKIYLTETKVKFNMPGSTTLFAMGKIVGSNFSLIGNNNNQFYKVETSGVINDLSGAASDFASSYCKQKLVSAGYNILTTNVEVKAYEVGDNVEDWQSYILVS